MPSQATGGMRSSSTTHAITAATGGTRKNSAETRDASPCRIIASSSVSEMIELPITR